MTQDIIAVTRPLAEETAKAASLLVDPASLHTWLQGATPEDRSAVYDRAKNAVKVMNDLARAIEAWALNTSEPMSGYQMGSGRSSRVWAVTPEVVAMTITEKFGIDREKLFELASPAGVEKLLGNSMEGKQAVAGLVEVVAGGLALVPVKKGK